MIGLCVVCGLCDLCAWGIAHRKKNNVEEILFSSEVLQCVKQEIYIYIYRT